MLVTGGPGAGKTTHPEAIGAVKKAIGSYGGPQSPARYRTTDTCVVPCKPTGESFAWIPRSGTWKDGNLQYQGPYQVAVSPDGTQGTYVTAPLGWTTIALQSFGGPSCGKYYFASTGSGPRSRGGRTLRKAWSRRGPIGLDALRVVDPALERFDRGHPSCDFAPGPIDRIAPVIAERPGH